MPCLPSVESLDGLGAALVGMGFGIGKTAVKAAALAYTMGDSTGSDGSGGITRTTGASHSMVPSSSIGRDVDISGTAAPEGTTAGTERMTWEFVSSPGLRSLSIDSWEEVCGEIGTSADVCVGGDVRIVATDSD